jgi:hypothetical protein
MLKIIHILSPNYQIQMLKSFGLEQLEFKIVEFSS